ncbi:perforin-1-like [Nelusetta ayraudi]|uniref:perforin-1-like n=1 Tax=Nelusetta ayraudi TaxID=303726 RepID=UPI003F71AD23
MSSLGVYITCGRTASNEQKGIEITASQGTMASRLSLFLLVVCSLAVAQAQLRVFNLRASDLPSGLLAVTDGYVTVFSGSTLLGKTAVRNNDKNPWWEEEFTWFLAEEGDTLKLEVHDSDFLFDDLIGTCARQMIFGTYNINCFLEKGGTLHYSYTLGWEGQ